MLEAKRGYIYKFDDRKRDEDRYVLVVSSDERERDNRISILMLGDSDVGHDVVRIKCDGMGSKPVRYVHCAMITYTNREYLVKEVCKLPNEKMEKIDKIICREFGLLEDLMFTANFYKNAYNELVDRLVNKEIDDGK